MNEILENFIGEIEKNQELKHEFAKCKNLKESYYRFMKDKCKYSEYESFFENLIKEQTQLCDQDLAEVCGGISLKKMLAPITIVTMLAGVGTISAYAAPSENFPSSLGAQKVSSKNSSKTNSVKKEIDGISYYITVKAKTVYICGCSDGLKTLSIQNISEKLGYALDRCFVGAGIEHVDIGKEEKINLNFNFAKDLKSVSVDKDNKQYFADQLTLWEKDSQGNLAKLIKTFGGLKNQAPKFSKINLDGIECSIYPNSHNQPTVVLKSIGRETTLNIQNLHEKFNHIPTSYTICSGIKHVDIGKEEKINLNFNFAKDLKSVSVDKENKKYSTDGFALYSADNSKKGEKDLKFLFGEGRIGGGKVNFSTENDYIFLQGVGSEKTETLDLSIFNHIIKKYPNKKLKIGPGIESIKLENQDVDISDASNLKSIDLSNNNQKYKIIGNNLWTIDYKGDEIKDLGHINKQLKSVYDFCFDRIKELPKLEAGEKFENLSEIDRFKPFLALKTADIQNNQSDPKIMAEKQTIFDQIQNKVDELKKKVQERTSSKHKDMTEPWRVAKAIYRWVAKNISYDRESRDQSKRKLQDPLYVFKNQMGVCEGYTLLTNLMMRMAGIPSVEVLTLRNKDTDLGEHAYTAIYLPNSQTENQTGKKDQIEVDNKKSGWVLLDATWGSPNKDATKEKVVQLNENQKERLKKFFPGFYSKGTKLKNDNEKILDLHSHKIKYLNAKNIPVSVFKIFGVDLDRFSTTNLEFEPAGSVENPLLRISSKGDQVIKNLKVEDIPKDLMKYNLPIEIGPGIEHFDIGMTDNITFRFEDFDNSTNLKSVSVDKDNMRYFADEVAIWKKDPQGNPKDILKILKNEGFCGEGENKFKYHIWDDKIDLYGKNVDVDKLPVSLKLIARQQGKSLCIRNCSQAFHLGKNDDMDLKFGYLFKPEAVRIDKENTRYFADEIAIWGKDSQGNPKDILKILKKEGFCGEGENKIEYKVWSSKIDLYGKNINVDKLPVSLKLIARQQGKSLRIRNCSKIFHLGKDDDMDLKFGDEFSLESIIVDQGNKRYEMRGNVLFDKSNNEKIYEIKNG